MISSNKKVLGIFSLIMITITSIDSVRNLPAAALFGSSLVFFFILAAICFLIPSALVSAELSATLPEQIGVYGWVKKALGDKMGILAIWLQWLENAIWYPTLLSFIAGTLAYLLNPQLLNNKLYLVGVILGIFWLITLANLRGVKASVFITIICGTFGLILPMLVIIGLGIYWVIAGKQLQINLNLHSMLPNMHSLSSFTALNGIILCCCGMELIASYINYVRNPQKSYPKALFISSLIIILTLIGGSLSIAFIIPHNDLNLISGLMQAFAVFFKNLHMSWLLPITAILVVLGSIAGLNSWILGPTRGLAFAFYDMNIFAKLQGNKTTGIPNKLLWLQGFIVSIISMVFIFIPSINAAYWILTVSVSQLYMMMYILVFISAIKLRLHRGNAKTIFKIPGGSKSLYFFAILGIVSCLIVVIVGFIPPPGIQLEHAFSFELILLSLCFFGLIFPFLLMLNVFKQLKKLLSNLVSHLLIRLLIAIGGAEKNYKLKLLSTTFRAVGIYPSCVNDCQYEVL